MNGRRISKLVHEGTYAAEVEVGTIFTDDGWSPYLSVEDAYKLDDVRAALKRGHLKAATRIARVCSLTPVAAWRGISDPPNHKTVFNPLPGLIGNDDTKAKHPAHHRADPIRPQGACPFSFR